MTGRPRLRVGNHGNITAKKKGNTWVAHTRVCDLDGVVREVERRGASKQDSLDQLQEALRQRPGFGGGGTLTWDSLFRDVADKWMAEIDAQVAAGERAPNTARVYRGTLKRHINPVFGRLAIREATVTRCSDFLHLFRASHKASLTRTVRTVLSGVMGYATVHGLVHANPVREVKRLAGDRRKKVKALTDVQREKWLAAMEADEVAVWHDLPDMTRFMLATGCRIGECLAVYWDDVDFSDKTVSIDWTIIRLEDRGGLSRTPTKSAAGARTLHIPGWAVDMLLDRYAKAGNNVGPIFPPRPTKRGRQSKHPWKDPSNISRAFREARERAGFGGVTSHVFRKTVATILHEAGLTDREVADHLGHSNTRTLQHYLGRRTTGEAAAAALELGWEDEPS